MPKISKANNPGLWLRGNRLGAGYETAATLAEQLGVSRVIASAWERNANRPQWGHMVNLAEKLRVPLEDLVKRLWREKIGDPCPCGCGGKTVAPEHPGAKALAVRLPCAKCGTKRIYRRRGKGSHRKLCKRCTQLAERVEFTCIGYNDHGATYHSRKCPHKIFLRPMDIHARQKDRERFPRSLFDAISRRFQCKWCGGAARLIPRTEKDLRGAYTKRYPNRNVLKIRSRKQRLELLCTYHAERSPKLKATRETQELGRRVFAEKRKTGQRWPNKTKTNLVRHWSGKELPRGIRFGLCLLVCGKIAITYGEKAPRFHQACYREWRRNTPDGRDFFLGRIRGLETRLPSPGPGRPVSDENLKTAFSWAIQNRLGRKSYREIATENRVYFTTVRKKIEYLMEKLPPPRLVSSRSRQIIELLLNVPEKPFSGERP